MRYAFGLARAVGRWTAREVTLFSFDLQAWVLLISRVNERQRSL
jgi:hypothetical protein